MFYRRINPSMFRFAQPRIFSPPCRALPRLDSPVICSSFGLDRWIFSPIFHLQVGFKILIDSLVLKSGISFCSLSVPKTRHTTGEMGRSGARRSGGTRQGRAERNADGSIRPEDNRFLLPPEHHAYCPERFFKNTNKETLGGRPRAGYGPTQDTAQLRYRILNTKS